MGTKPVDIHAKGKSGSKTSGTYGGEKSGPIGHERTGASHDKLGLHGGHTLSKEEGRMEMQHGTGGGMEGSPEEEAGESKKEAKMEGDY